MQFNGEFRVVGLEPESARRLAGMLDDVGGALDAQSIRIQSLLDQAGVACTAPATIRSVGRTCGESAYDLRRRAGLLRAPVLDVSAPQFRGGLGLTGGPPGSSCGPVSGLPEEPVQPSPWAALGSGGLIAGLRLGPWVTPVGPGRTGPWITPGITTLPGGQPGVGGPDIVRSAGPTQPCEMAPLSGGLVAKDLAATASKPRHYTEEELDGASETLTEAEKEAVRLRQAGKPYVRDDYTTARGKLIKSEKVADTRNVGKERGGPNK